MTDILSTKEQAFKSIEAAFNKLQAESSAVYLINQEAKTSLEAQVSLLTAEKTKLLGQIKETEDQLVIAIEAKESYQSMIEELELARDNITNFEAS